MKYENDLKNILSEYKAGNIAEDEVLARLQNAN